MTQLAITPLTGHDTLSVSPQSIERNSKNSILAPHGESLVRMLNQLDKDNTNELLRYQKLDAELCENIVLDLAKAELLQENIATAKNLDHEWLGGAKPDDTQWDYGADDNW